MMCCWGLMFSHNGRKPKFFVISLKNLELRTKKKKTLRKLKDEYIFKYNANCFQLKARNST